MLLEVGGEGVRFKPRVAEGAPENGSDPEQLTLDGQQRMTSLYLALRSGKRVPTRANKGKDIDRVYLWSAKSRSGMCRRGTNVGGRRATGI